MGRSWDREVILCKLLASTSGELKVEVLMVKNEFQLPASLS